MSPTAPSLSVPPPNDPPPGLDLRSLQMEKAASVLRDWAETTTGTLLVASRSDAEGPGRLRDLKLRPSGDSIRGQRRLTHRALKSLPLRDDTVRIEHPISLLILTHLRASRSGWISWLPRPRALVEPYWPPSLWGAIAGLAWREPRFQRQIGAIIFDHFRRTQPVPGGELPAPVLRQEVWWLLVGLVGAPEMEEPPARGIVHLLRKILGHRLAEALWRIWYQRSTGGRLQRRLAEIARAQALASSGWAGFWEQWMVGETLLRRPREVARASTHLRQLLTLLPLLSKSRYQAARDEFALASSDDLTSVGPRIVDPGWQKQMPGWFQADNQVF